MRKIRQHQKKLLKKGLTLNITQGPSIEHPVTSPSGKTLLIPAIPFEIDAPVLKNEEWTVVAKVVLAANAPPVVYGLTDDFIPEALLEESVCQHCHREVPRKTVYLLKHKEGYFQRVGSSCVDEYAGISAQSIASHYKLVDALHSIMDWGKENDINWAETYGVKEAVAASLTLMQATGYISSKRAAAGGAVSSKAMVEEALRNQEQLTHSEAQEVLEWLRDIYPITKGEVPVFYSNVARVVNADLCTVQSLGFLVWAVSLWFEKNAPVSQWVGKEGEKAEALVTLLSVSEHEGRWGTVYRHQLKTEAGDTLVWSTSSSQFQIGESYRVSFKVSSHDEFKGRKETRIQRMKLL